VETAPGGKLLLMGSSKFRAGELPAEVRERIEEAMADDATIIVGEAHGACRLYQDYLRSRGYGNVIVGHAKRIRYNAGGWRDIRYGDDLIEKERRMIEECDSAVVIWADGSGVIAQDLELLRRLGKPTFVYEYSTRDQRARAGEIDPMRTYDPYYSMKEYHRKRRQTRKDG